MNTEHTAGTNELTNLLDTLWRRKWFIIVPFLIISPLVVLYGLYLPNLYRSSVSIYIEPQKIPQDYVRSTVTTDMSSRIRTIKQQLTSRTKLLRVINDLNLYAEDVQKQILNEVLVSRMRDNLEIEVANQRDLNFFMVHYTHADPTKAMLGVSRLVSLFIEESLQIREDQAVGTTRFLEEELGNVKKKLEKQEATIQWFKRQHIGELPDQLDSNLRMLDNLNLQLQDNMESQREVESRVIFLEQEIAKLGGQIQVAADGSVTGGSNLLRLLQQRDALQQEISRLEPIYTPRHPDLISAKKALAKIEEEIRTVQKNLNTQPDTPSAISPATAAAQFSPEFNNLRRQLNANKPRLAALAEEERNLRERIEKYQLRVESAPKREQQILSLTRDYENTRQNYQDLLNKKQSAQLSQNLEKRQEGEKFRVLDPANLPEKPHLPNRPKIILLGLVGGLGLGIGLVFLLESLFPAFHSLKSVQSSLDIPDIPIIMAIPEIVIPGERKKNAIRLLLRAAAGAAVTAVFLFLLDRYVLDLTGVAVQIGKNIRSMRL